jgi:hypothetical protein
MQVITTEARIIIISTWTIKAMEAIMIIINIKATDTRMNIISMSAIKVTVARIITKSIITTSIYVTMVAIIIMTSI